jgi:hypothetical protein
VRTIAVGSANKRGKDGGVVHVGCGFLTGTRWKRVGPVRARLSCDFKRVARSHGSGHFDVGAKTYRPAGVAEFWAVRWNAHALPAPGGTFKFAALF